MMGTGRGSRLAREVFMTGSDLGIDMLCATQIFASFSSNHSVTFFV